ncbi:MAG: hypothetical protein CMJ31_07290 [Phycisphaerae bacterium]|nr:hypothetical protein [Phycisphaerae bacterium]
MNRSIRTGSTLILAATLGVASAVASGCKQTARVNYEDARKYPDLVQEETLNVQVFRLGTNLRLTNTTAHTLPAGTLWLNRWFFREVESVEPGESLHLPLKGFRDRYGESFRAGGFFATRDPDLVVLAQLEANGELHGLIVVENRAE